MIPIVKSILTVLLVLCSLHTLAAPNVLKLAVLAYGTVNWELRTIENQRLDEKYQFKLDLRTVANPQAAKVALQAGAVDIIVSDWVWVARQRGNGAPYTFSPYSNTAGALIVAPESHIKDLRDLVGKRIGIAGGELDKNWLLLIAMAKQNENIDLDHGVEKIYGAPPLLSQQLQRKDLDAILTYWHYAAKLEAMGYPELLNGRSILEGLGIRHPLATLGYVFDENWANKNRRLLLNFFAATVAAKNLLCESDSAWSQIVPLMRVEQPKVLAMYRSKYCAGRIKQWGSEQIQSAARVFALLHQLAGPKLTGPRADLDSATFWTQPAAPELSDSPPESKNGR